MLVITGTQRSGTSLVAQMFQKEGYDLGTEWWDDKAEGGLDNPLICAFYRDHLGDKTFPFDDMKLPKLSTRELRSRFDFSVPLMIRICRPWKTRGNGLRRIGTAGMQLG